MTRWHRRWRVAATAGLVCAGALAAGEQAPPATGPWRPYGDRIGIVVMAGNVEHSPTPHYGWYWNDTFGMYTGLLELGFSPDKVFFLSYGPEAAEHEDAVWGKPTTKNTKARKNPPSSPTLSTWFRNGQ